MSGEPLPFPDEGNAEFTYVPEVESLTLGSATSGKRRQGRGPASNREPELAADIRGRNFPRLPDEGHAGFTMAPEVESLTRGSATAPPTSARRESADSDASYSTMSTSGADFQPWSAATQTTVSTKQSTPGPFQAARTSINPTKVRRLDLWVDSELQSTHLQSEVTDYSQFRPIITSMASHRTTAKSLQTLSTATAEVVASSSPTPSQRSAYNISNIVSNVGVIAFSATSVLTGREDSDETKRLLITTTTCGNVVSRERESVSDAQRLVRRDTPSSTLSSTDGEVAYLTGSRAPTYVRPEPLLPPLVPPPSTRSRSHRSGRSSISRASKVSRLTSASQHSLIDVNELVRNVLRQTVETERGRLEAERQRFEAAARAERERQQAEREAERQRLEAIAATERDRLQLEVMRAEAVATAERERAAAATAAEENQIRAAAEAEKERIAATAATEKERFEAVINAERERAAAAAAAEKQRVAAVTFSAANADRERAIATIEAEQCRIQKEQQQRWATEERQREARRAEELKRLEVEQEKIAAEKERAAQGT